MLDGVVTFAGPGSWTADGRTLVYDSFEMNTAGDLSTVSVDDPKPVPVLRTGYFEFQARLSPGDGHWLAYVSNESGRYEVYVRGFRASEGKWLVSSEGGSEPFTLVAEDLTYPAPSGAVGDSYIFYIGFDPQALKPERPAPKKKKQ